MRVIRNDNGWDVALDIVFKEKQTALEVARRMEHGVYALLRAAMDESMRPSETPEDNESHTRLQESTKGSKQRKVEMPRVLR